MSKLNYCSNSVTHLILEDASLYMGIIDGAKIVISGDFYEAMAKAFQFPDYFGKNLDALEEMLLDLSWIEQFNVTLVIKNSDHLFASNQEVRNQLLTFLEELDNVYFEVILL